MIELTEEQVRQAFKKAESDDAKGILTSLFPDIAKELTKKKPTLDDYTSITSYEDACEALGINKIPYKLLDMRDHDGVFVYHIPDHIIALMKLETISRALWGRNWKPKPDAEGSMAFFLPRFYLWTDKIISNMDDTKKLRILSGTASNGKAVNFGCLYERAVDSCSVTSVSFRLCQETEEKARYFGSRHFVKLWAEYLQFNFTTGDFISDLKGRYIDNNGYEH